MAMNEMDVFGRVAKINMRYTPDGTPVTNVTVAAERGYSRSDNTKVRETTFLKCTLWRGVAETVNRYVSKGQKLILEGCRLEGEKQRGTPYQGTEQFTVRPRIWSGDDGQPRADFELTCRGFQFADSSRGSSSSSELPSEEVDADLFE